MQRILPLHTGYHGTVPAQVVIKFFRQIENTFGYRKILPHKAIIFSPTTVRKTDAVFIYQFFFKYLIP